MNGNMHGGFSGPSIPGLPTAHGEMNQNVSMETPNQGGGFGGKTFQLPDLNPFDNDGVQIANPFGNLGGLNIHLRKIKKWKQEIYILHFAIAISFVFKQMEISDLDQRDS